MSEGATSAPVPSKFIFLHEAVSQPPGTKVRLLGCIVECDTSTGQILLEHAYPRPFSILPQLWVDVTLVVESTKPSVIRPGTWINVIGYVRRTPPGQKRKDNSEQKQTRRASHLQAVLLWDAGPLRVEDYELTLEEQRRVQREANMNGNRK